MNIEDILGQVMASHDQEAPTAADLLRALETVPRHAGRRSRQRSHAGWYLPLAAAAAVTAVVVGSLWAGGLMGGARPAPPSPATALARLSCPARYAGQAPWVPARPSGMDSRARLVPAATPSSALVCAYAGRNTARQQAGWALSGRRRLASGLTALATQLSQQPRAPSQPIACTDVGGPQTNYLIGLTYPGGGTIWITATQDPNSCVATSNGQFTSTSSVAPIVAKAYTTSRWPTNPATTCPQHGHDTGRLGRETVIVPPIPTC